MRNKIERVYKEEKKGGLRMKPIIILFCLSLLLLFAISFVFADAIVNVEQTKTELLKPYIQTGVAAKEIPMKHLSSKIIAKESILGGFDRRDAPWSPDTIAGDGLGGFNPDKYTSMAIGPDGSIYAAYQTMDLVVSDWAIGIAKSTDNGQSWTGNTVTSAGIDYLYPDIAIDDDGYIWVFVTRDDGTDKCRAFARSTDPNDISSFSINSSITGGDYLHPSADAFGSDGVDLHVFSAWTYDDGTADDQMCIVYNTDGFSSGGGWTIKTFPKDGYTDMHPDVAISDNNVIMANIEDVSGDQELRIWYLDIASVWAGSDWSAWEYTIAGDDDYPSIFATGTNVFVAFQNYAGINNWDIMHGNSTNDGATWDMGNYVANTAISECYPRVAGLGDATGVVYLKEYIVWFRQSASFGQEGTWEPDIASDPERVTNPALGAANDSARSASLFHTGSWWIATWEDDRYFEMKNRDIWSSSRDAVAISFTNLTAIGYVEKIELKWRTESEYNIEAWQVVRSETAEDDYTLIGVLPGQGSTSVPHDYLFTDSDVIGGKRYYYKLVSIDNMGTTAYGPVSAVARIGSTVGIFSLVSNPTRSASIRFSVFEDSRVSIKVYSVTGRLVKTLVNDVLSSDSYEISWDGRSETGRHVGSGVYFIKMDAAGEKATLKLTLLK